MNLRRGDGMSKIANKTMGLTTVQTSIEVRHLEWCIYKGQSTERRRIEATKRDAGAAS